MKLAESTLQNKLAGYRLELLDSLKNELSLFVNFYGSDATNDIKAGFKMASFNSA